jgi:hypothetical protein
VDAGREASPFNDKITNNNAFDTERNAIKARIMNYEQNGPPHIASWCVFFPDRARSFEVEIRQTFLGDQTANGHSARDL